MVQCALRPTVAEARLGSPDAACLCGSLGFGSQTLAWMMAQHTLLPTLCLLVLIRALSLQDLKSPKTCGTSCEDFTECRFGLDCKAGECVCPEGTISCNDEFCFPGLSCPNCTFPACPVGTPVVSPRCGESWMPEVFARLSLRCIVTISEIVGGVVSCKALYACLQQTCQLPCKLPVINNHWVFPDLAARQVKTSVKDHPMAAGMAYSTP